MELKISQETKVIVVEDNNWVRKMIGDQLKEFNMEIIGEASNGLEAIELLRTLMPDVLLLDLEMPEMNGSETFDYIKKYHPDVKVLILSSYKDETVIANYLARGACGFLHKSYLVNAFLFASAILDVKEYGFYETSIPANALKFTNREIEIVPKLVEGKTSKEIGTILNMSEKAVNKHRDKVFKKSKVHSVREFINTALKRGYEFLSRV